MSNLGALEWRGSRVLQRAEYLCNVRQMRQLNLLLAVTMTIIYVGTATRLWGLGVRFPAVSSDDYLHSILTGYGAHPVSTGGALSSCVDRDVNLNIHLHLEPGLRMGGAVPPFPRRLQGAMLN
jgi:hypothetical protein